MLKYLFRRILLFIPTLIIISLLAFVISVSAPDDPVSRMMTTSEPGGDMMSQGSDVQLQQKKFWTHRLGLDLPVFYFSITPLSFPDTLNRIYDRHERDAQKSLLHQYGNWNAIEKFEIALRQLSLRADNISPDSASQKQFSNNEIREAIQQSRVTTLSLLSTADAGVISFQLNDMQKQFSRYPFFSSLESQRLQAAEDFEAMQASPQPWKNFIPAIHFYPHNQYHRWIFGDGNWITGKGSIYSKGLIRGDLGISFATNRPVSVLIWEHIGWSLLLTFISIILAYLISLPIGILSAAKQGSLFDRASAVIVFLLYSMPSFWVATLLLIFFANPDMLWWFPAAGVKPVTGYPDHASFLTKVSLTLPYLVLPLLAYTYGSMAFLSRLTRVSMLEVYRQDYIQTARAKGLSERRVIYRHAFRNALLPIITVFANILPAAIGGSVIIESIFTIPGMGLETYKAIIMKDYPMIVGVFTLAGVLTLIAYLLADILYALADPRISFSKN